MVGCLAVIIRDLRFCSFQVPILESKMCQFKVFLQKLFSSMRLRGMSNFNIII